MYKMHEIDAHTATLEDVEYVRRVAIEAGGLVDLLFFDLPQQDDAFGDPWHTVAAIELVAQGRSMEYVGGRTYFADASVESYKNPGLAARWVALCGISRTTAYRPFLFDEGWWPGRPTPAGRDGDVTGRALLV